MADDDEEVADDDEEDDEEQVGSGQWADADEEDDEEQVDEPISTAAGSGQGAVASVFLQDWSDLVGEAVLADDVRTHVRT